MLYGAIIGDIVGSRFEHCERQKKNEIEFFHKLDNFTDDSIMTLAIYEATKEIIDKNCDDQEALSIYIHYMKEWGKSYPDAGYGSSFKKWLSEDTPLPYNSWGNGSAMRVSAIGNMFNTLEETEKYAILSAEVSHNHTEGIKGAIAIAGSIYLARTTHNKRVIKKYIQELNYKIKPNFIVRPKHTFDVSCQGTIPVAIESFLESNSFEDAIRRAVSMGGDSDTLGAITGSIAEAYYGIPQQLITKCNTYLNDDILSVIC